jgi:hypothetical protein
MSCSFPGSAPQPTSHTRGRGSRPDRYGAAFGRTPVQSRAGRARRSRRGAPRLTARGKKWLRSLMPREVPLLERARGAARGALRGRRARRGARRRVQARAGRALARRQRPPEALRRGDRTPHRGTLAAKQDDPQLADHPATDRTRADAEAFCAMGVPPARPPRAPAKHRQARSAHTWHRRLACALNRARAARSRRSRSAEHWPRSRSRMPKGCVAAARWRACRRRTSLRPGLWAAGPAATDATPPNRLAVVPDHVVHPGLLGG